MNAKLFFAIWMVFCVSPATVVLAESSSDSPTWTYYCYPPSGGQYASTITAEMRNSSPDWADTAPNPPLSARKAIAIAEETLRATMKEEIDPMLERRLVGARLIPLGQEKWCWEVGYQWHRRVGSETGIPFDLRVFVLMNGKAVPLERHQWNGVHIEESTDDGKRQKNENKGGQATGLKRSEKGTSKAPVKAGKE